MLMNGKEVNHLVIAGEAFNKDYNGKSIEILNDIYTESTINKNGKYNKIYYGGIIPKGSKDYKTAIKFFDVYFIVRDDGISGGAWAQASDIKILD